MIFAAIDIGSNAVRLLFSNAYLHHNKIRIEKATLIRIPIRLGIDVYNTGKISRERYKKLLKTMKAFRHLIDVYSPYDYAACATAAIREASNGKEIIKKIKKHTGIKINILDGLEEASIIRSSDIHLNLPDRKFKVYVDLGGGSTEISITSEENLIAAKSFRLGTLRLLSQKVEDAVWEELKNWLTSYANDPQSINLIGSGGNINKLAKLYGNNDGTYLPVAKLEYALNHLKSYSLLERIEILGLRPDRADVIVPAAEIFLFISRILMVDAIFVPKIGVADGLIYQMFEKYIQQNGFNVSDVELPSSVTGISDF